MPRAPKGQPILCDENAVPTEGSKPPFRLKRQATVLQSGKVPKKAAFNTLRRCVLGEITNATLSAKQERRLKAKPPIKQKREAKVVEELICTEVMGNEETEKNPNAEIGEGKTAQSTSEDSLENLFDSELDKIPSSNYMDMQADITVFLRETLVDWLVTVQVHYRLRVEVLYVAVNLTDRFLERQPVSRTNLQLVGCSALFIATNSVHLLNEQDLVDIADGAFTKLQLIEMNRLISALFGPCTNVPTALRFGSRLCKNEKVSPKTEQLVRYLMELTLQDSNFLRYRPSAIAAAATYLAMKCANHVWDAGFEAFCRYSPQSLQNLLRDLERLASRGSSRLRAVRKKYSRSKFLAVALDPICEFFVAPKPEAPAVAPAYLRPSALEASPRVSAQQRTTITAVDKADRDDPQCVFEYISDIMDDLFASELAKMLSKEYCQKQTPANLELREQLVNWLVEVHLKFELNTEVLHLTVNLVDRFLERQPVSSANLQLVGCTAMLIAAKYELRYSAASIRNFVRVSKRLFSEEQMTGMEELMLNTLGFCVTTPTALRFGERLCRVAQVAPKTEQFIYYLMELTLQDARFLRYRPSGIATAAAYLGMKCTGHVCDAAFETHSRYTLESLKNVLGDLQQLAASENSKCGAVRKKYSRKDFLEVSKIPLSGL